MSNRFKIFGLAFVLGLSLCSSLSAMGQTYETTKPTVTSTGKTDEGTTPLIEGGNVVQGGATIGITSSQATNKLVGITAEYYDGATKQDISSLVGKTSESFIKYTLVNDKYDIGSAYARLFQLTVINGNMPKEVSGKTVYVTVNLNNTRLFIYKFDALCAPEIVDATGWDFSDAGFYPTYNKAFCKDDEIVIKIDNDENPYGTTPTKLNHTYKVIYGWSLTDEATSASDVYTPSGSDTYKKFTAPSALTKGSSNTYVFTLSANVYDETNTFIQTFTMGYYNIQYDAPLDVNVECNGTIGVRSSDLKKVTSPFVVCEGEDVVISGIVLKDDAVDDDITFTLYNVTSGSRVKVGESRMPYALGDDLVFNLGPLDIKEGKNTTYKFEVAAEDDFNWYAQSTCQSELAFEVLVMEKSAVIKFPANIDAVCEDGNVSLSATITGGSMSDYSCTWSGVDCTPDFGGGKNTSTSGAYSVAAVDNGVAFNGGTRTYRLTVSNKGCEIYKDVKVTSYERPVLTPVDASVYVCKGEEIPLKVTSSQENVDITWHQYSSTGTVDGTPSDGGLANTITGTVTMPYYVTGVNEHMCTTKDPAVITVNVNSQPDIVAFADVTVCEESKTNLSAVVSGGEAPYVFHWSWTEGGVHYEETTNSSSNTGIYEFVPKADVTSSTKYEVEVYATDKNNCSLGAKKTATVTVLPTPEFTAKVGDACDGESGTFTFSDASLSYSLVSTTAPSTTATSFSGNVCTVNFAKADINTPQTYSFTFIGKTVSYPSCEYTETFTMKVNPLPTITAKVDDDDICLGMAVNFSYETNVPAADATIVWTDASNNVINPVKYKPETTGNLAFFATVTNKKTGCKQTASVVVKVSSPLPLTITSTKDPICEGESTELTSSLNDPAYGYAWTPTTKLSATDAVSVTATPTATTTYKLVVTDTHGCKSEATTTVNVNKKPVIKAVATPSEVCASSNATVSLAVQQTNPDASTISYYIWNGTNTTANPYEYSELWTGSSKTLKVVAVSDKGCNSKEVSVKVTIHPKPATPAPKASPAKICKDSGDAVELSVTPKTGFRYEWFDDHNIAVGTGSAISVTPNVTTTYTVIAYDDNFLATSCPSDPATVVVTVNELPVVSIIPATASICEGEKQTFKASASFKSYAWSNGSTENSITVSEADTYTLVVTDNNGCSNITPASAELVVNAKPKFNVTVKEEVCYDSKSVVNIDLNVTDGNVTSYTCVETGANIPATSGNASYQIKDVTWTTNPTVYHFTATSGSCVFNDAADQVPANIVVNTKPDAPVVPKPETICEDETTVVKISSPKSTYTYRWFSDAECLTSPLFEGKGNAGASFTTPKLSATTTFYVKSFLGECGSDITSVSVDVAKYPSAPAIATASSVLCSNDADLGVALKVASPSSSLTYIWYNADTNEKVGEGETITVYPKNPSSGYYVTATNDAGCESDHSSDVVFTVNVSPELEADIFEAEHCESDGFELSVTAKGSNLEYHWSVDEAENLAKSTITYPATTSGKQTVSVYVKDAVTGCESSPVDFDLMVHAKPKVFVSPSPADVCEGDEVKLTVSTDVKNFWPMWGSKGEGDDKINYFETSNPLSFVPETKTEYYVNIYDYDTWCDATEKVNLTVYGKPDVTIDGKTALCTDNVLDIKIVPNDGMTYTYEWTNGTINATGDRLYKDKVNADYDGNFVVTLKNTVGCTTTLDVPVVVNDYALTKIIGNDYVCLGGSVSIEAEDKAMKSYSWDAKVDGVSIATSTEAGFAFDASSYPVGKAINVTLDYEDDLCDGLQQSLTIIVRELPEIDKVDGLEYCLYPAGDMSLVANIKAPIAGSTYTYYWSHNGTEVSTSTNTYSPAISAENAGAWSVYAIEAVDGVDRCQGPAFDFNITVHDFEVTLKPNQTKFCKASGDSFSVDVDVTTDELLTSFTYDYILKDASDATINSVVGSGAKYSYSTITDLELGDYTLTVTVHSPFGCDKTLDPMAITVVQAPGKDLLTSSVCVGEEVTFTADGNADKWEFFVGGVSMGTQDSNTFTKAGLAKGTEVYAVLTLGTCTVTSNPKTVDYYDVFTVSADPAFDLICENSSVNYTISSTSLKISSYDVLVKHEEDADFVTVKSIILDTPEITTSYAYSDDLDYKIKFYVTSEEGCKAETNATSPNMSHINVDDISVVEDNFDFCVGHDYEVTIKTSGAIKKLVGGEMKSNLKFVVNTHDGSPIEVLSDKDEIKVTLQFSKEGSFTVDVNVIDLEAFCTDDNKIEVTVHALPTATLNPTSHTASSANIYEPCYGDPFIFDLSGSTFVLNLDGVDIAADDLAAAGFTVTGTTVQYVTEYPESHTIYATIFDSYCHAKTNEVVVKPHSKIAATYNTKDGPAEVDNTGLLMICEGDNITVNFSSADVTGDITLSLDGTAVGVNSATVDAQVLAGADYKDQILTATAPNGCERVVTVRTMKAPKTAIEITDENDNSVHAVIGSYSGDKICSDESLIIKATGASRFNLSATLDGAPLADVFPVSYDGTEFVIEKKFSYIENGADYNEYVLTYTGFVGTCEDSEDITFRVYKNPEVSLNASAALVLANTTLTFTATDGYESYNFFVDGVSKAVQDGSMTDKNVFTYTVADVDVHVSVIATTYYDCSATDDVDVKVLEGLAPSDVVVSNDYYCTPTVENPEVGVTISVLTPQLGITYELNECTSCASVTYDGVNPVEWNNVTVLPGQTKTTYSVKAYHESLPTEYIMMNNKVTITEVNSPDKYDLSPSRTDKRCDAAALIKLSSSQVGAYYQLYLNGNPLGAEIAGNGSELEFIIADQIGKYTISAYSRYTDEGGNTINTCAVTMNGAYIIDVPSAQEFEIVADPANGNYCEDGDAVVLSLEGSEIGKVYKLFRDGVVVKVDETEVSVLGTGDAITFGKFAEDGHYTVSCFYDGCSTQMLEYVDLKKWARPVTQVVTTSNFGHYCADEKGGVVTVGGQQDGYLYTLYNGSDIVKDENDLEISHLGDDTGSAFSWSDIPAGTYTIKITIPAVKSGCETNLDAFTIVKDELPAQAVIRVTDANGVQGTEATICETDYATITLYNTQADVEYVLLRDGVDYATRVDDTETHSFSFNNIGEAGVYTVRATVTYDLGDGNFTSCATVFDESVKVTVVPRPAGSATLSHETPAEKLAADACYGEDIIVTGAQKDFVYMLYRVEGSDEFLMNDYTFTAVGDPTYDRFENVQTNAGTFKVYVSNGSCSDPVGTVDLVNTKYVDPQTVVGDKSMCQGDEGLVIGLAGAEVDVTYRLYGPGIDTPEEHTATAAEVLNGFSFNTLMDQEGIYYVTGANSTGCEIKMYPEIDFKVYPLPISFELQGNSYYCSDEGMSFVLAGSELGVEYTLYSKDELGVLSPIQTIIGTGSELKFKAVKVGSYEASARNTITKCTSSMLGELTISQRPAIESIVGTADELVEHVSCSTNAKYSYDKKLTADATYYLVKGVASPEDGYLQSVLSDGVTPITFSFTESGDYTIYAAYGDDFSCLTVYSSVSFSLQSLSTFEVTAEGGCEGKVTVTLTDTEVGVTYTIRDHEDVVGKKVGNTIVWEVPMLNGGTETFIVDGAYDACDIVVGQATAAVLPDVMVEQINVINCGDGSDGKLTLKGEDLVYGATYYLVKGNKDPLSGNVGFKRYNGSDIEFSLPETGTYSVYASLNNECFMEVYSVLFSIREVKSDYDVVAVADCDGSSSITLSGSQTGIQYTLTGLETKNGTGKELVWNFAKRPTNTVILSANAGQCKVDIDTIEIYDFKSDVFESVEVTSKHDCNVQSVSFDIAQPQDSVQYTLYINEIAQAEPATSWKVENDGKALYEIYGTKINSSCAPYLVYAETVDFSAVNPIGIPPLTSCDEVYTLKLNAVEAGVTYYLIDASKSTPNADSQAQYSDGKVSLQFLLSESGSYKIVASRGNGCFNTVSEFTYTSSAIYPEQVKIDADVECDGTTASITLSNIQSGVTYYLGSTEGVVSGNTVTWSANKDITSIITGKLGSCETTVAAVKPSDFKSAVFAAGNVTAVGGCDGEITVTLDTKEPGVDYTLIMDGVETSYAATDNVWVVPVTGTHKFSVKATNSASCQFIYNENNEAKASSSAAFNSVNHYIIDNENNIVIEPVCLVKQPKLHIMASTMTVGVKYQLMRLISNDGVDTEIAYKKAFVYDGDGQDRVYDLQLGTYIVRASSDASGCSAIVDVIDNNINGVSDFEYKVSVDTYCDGTGEAVISVTNPSAGVTYTLDGPGTRIDETSWRVTTAGSIYKITATKDCYVSYIDGITVKFDAPTIPVVNLVAYINDKLYNETVTPEICKTTPVILIAETDAADLEYTFVVNGVEVQKSKENSYTPDFTQLSGVVTVTVTASSSECVSDPVSVDIKVNAVSADASIFFAEFDADKKIIESSVSETNGIVDDEMGRVVLVNAQKDVVYTLIHKGVELMTQQITNDTDTALLFGPVYSDIKDHPGHGIGDYYVRATSGGCETVYGPITFTELSVATINKEVTVDCATGTKIQVIEPKIGWTYSLSCEGGDVKAADIAANGGEVAWTIVEPVGKHNMIIKAVKGNSEMATEPFVVEVNPIINVLADFADILDCKEVVIDLTTVASDTATIAEAVDYELVNDKGVVLASATKANPQFTLSESGNYTIWAHGPSAACDMEVSHVNYIRPTLEGESIVVDPYACKNTTTIRVADPKPATTYYGVELGEPIISDEGDIYWVVEGAGVASYNFTATKNSCVLDMNSVSVDFSQSVAPKTEMVLLVNGDEVKTDSVAICPSSKVWFYGNTSDAIVASYGFKFYKQYTENGVVKTKLIDDKYSEVNPSFIYKPTMFDNGDTIIVSMSVKLASSCEFDSIASRTLFVKNSVLAGTRLYTKEDVNQYCEGENGLTLAFSDVEKGITYRLWKYTDPYKIVEHMDEINRDSVDLVDIQELPDYYPSSHAEEIIFNGWSFNGTTYNNNATSGFYYVTLETSDGCDASSNIVEIIRNPLPYGDDDVNVDTIPNVYFAAGSYVDGIAVVADDTKNPEYGLLDTGFMVFENAHDGYKYELVHLGSGDKDDYVLQTITDVKEGETLYFGPIVSEDYRIVNTYDENGAVVATDSVNVMGIGNYTIRVTDMTHVTECQNTLGFLTFIDEELITYNVYLYLNSDQPSMRANLIPTYGHKGNRRFLDWSTAIDKVYAPDKVDRSPDGSSIVSGDTNVEKYGEETGYSSLRGNLSKNANIYFELLDQSSIEYFDTQVDGSSLAKDTVTLLSKYEDGCNVDTTFTQKLLDTFQEGCDSSYVSTGYTYFKEFSDGTKINLPSRPSQDDFEDPNFKIDSVSVGKYQYYIMEPVYKYYRNVYFKINSLKDKMWGTCGFDDYDGTTNLLWESMTGDFVYRKSPGFYGQEVIPYRAYNAKMKNLRYSNTSYITVLCGNESVPGDSAVFLLPNAISPNGDGLNDKFYVLLPQEYEANHTSSLEVYNRWGTLVYRSSGPKYGQWNDPDETEVRVNGCPEWDGTSKTSNMLTVGEKLPQGTYFYIYTINFNIDGVIRSKKLCGYVELRR